MFIEYQTIGSAEVQIIEIVPIPPCVNYEAKRDRWVYTPRDVIHGWLTSSPSDCLWMVPIL